MGSAMEGKIARHEVAHGADADPADVRVCAGSRRTGVGNIYGEPWDLDMIVRHRRGREEVER